MIKLLALLTLMLSSANTSCDKERSLPETPPSRFERYTTDLTMYSDILGETIHYSIYLPADYTTATDKRYGVVYLLHGFGDNWVRGTTSGSTSPRSSTARRLPVRLRR